MNFKIITEASVDMPKNYADENNITILPIEVNFNGELYPEGLPADEFYKKLEILYTNLLIGIIIILSINFKNDSTIVKIIRPIFFKILLIIFTTFFFFSIKEYFSLWTKFIN